MMLDELIIELKQKDVRLFLENGKLRCRVPSSIFTTDLKIKLQDHKKELIEFLQEARHDENVVSINKVLQRDNLPLSFAQQRLWFLDQFEPNSAFYNMAGAIRLIGDLDVSVLRKSFNEIVRRHEVLRTTFDVEDGQPILVIAPTLELDMVVKDLSHTSENKRNDEVEHYLAKEAQKPFDLVQGPLVRATLLTLGVPVASDRKEHVLLFSMHHIVSDGWSNGILVREFVELYEAFRGGQPSPLPELTIQYADYAVWQREWLKGERLTQQLDYWKQQLTGIPAVMELSTDRPRPIAQSFRGASYRFTVPQNINAQLKALSRQVEGTLFMILLTGFNILLSRYSGQHDICVGTPVANRSRVEIEGLIGFFVNTLVLRADLSGNPTFKQLLERVKTVCLDAQAHQDLPFEKLVEELEPIRDMSRNPLIQVMFALQNIPDESLSIDDLQMKQVDMDTGTAKFDLGLEITERGEGLDAVFNYSTDLFDYSTIFRMAEHFKQLLESIVLSTNIRLADLTLLTSSERYQLLQDWNVTEAEFPQNRCIHQLFEARVKQVPDAVAVVFEDQSLTYGQLNTRANQLAHYLRSQGVEPEVLVGICVERSLEMVVGILGILKAGGAYVPIDPSYPQERIEFMLEDAQPVLSLVHAATRNVLLGTMCTIDMDSQRKEIAQLSEKNPSQAVQPQNLAYVIYTSGSTGKPKGAGLAHEGIVNCLAWMQRQYQLGACDRVLQKTPLSFDVSVLELFCPLLEGARLVIAPPEAHKDGAQLAEIIQRYEVTVLHFVPSMLSAFLDVTQVALCKSLKYVICIGEVLPASLRKQFFDKSQACLDNIYGPVEASIIATKWACEYESENAVIPIGRPIENTQVYLLDAFLNPVPVGVAGELYIGGVGLARGYQNRSALTAERFVPNPFSKRPGERLYRTGDLARYRADGNIEYLRRTDHQVKIRGFRIELGEVEASLLQHEQIKEAVVMVREDNPDDKRLVAYIVSAVLVPDTEKIRTHLKTHLPDYMVPAAFVLLNNLPLNMNGKLDRKEFPAPGVSEQLTHGYVAPRNPTEEILVDIWAQVLDVEKVGVHDNFFELGGHSLLVMQIVAKVRMSFDVDVPLESLFKTPTVSSLTHRIEEIITAEIENLSELEAERIAQNASINRG